MKYNTTSLSAITLCVCMMLSHHTNGMDMRGAPSSFTNNNPNQIPMTAQQWNQQPNTNMQVGSNNWNNAFRPTLPAPPSNNQGQPQPPEEITIDTTIDQRTERLYIHFPKKYNLEPIQWPLNFRSPRHQKEIKWGNKNALIACYKGSKRYANAKRFYDSVDRIDDPFHKQRLDTILFKRIANGQTADKEIGCFVFEQPRKYENFHIFIRRISTFASIKQLPSIVARVMDAISTLNDIGVVYGSIVTRNFWIAENAMGQLYDLKLLHFDCSTIYEDFRELQANSDFSPTSKLATIYNSFINNVRSTSRFIDSLFSSYKKKLAINFTPDTTITPDELEKHNKKREALKALMISMGEAIPPLMMLNFKITHQYDVISGKYD